MRAIGQEEAEEMRSALKQIAGFYNPAQNHDGGQAAALAAQETLEKLGLLYQEDVHEASGFVRTDSPRG